ncbi:hypothetical protein EST38_g5317 [Candolleomyces aberdarensis]|uniref:Protection of telomeres protein 1 n=1 Tax=Candolleomyces aberdarensis TaxID=2316362 RepID=A0A4V1Q417_9AGAR|nr:hypothetical protein EST38_g5317 [Candolleomyces aberdarensis]
MKRRAPEELTNAKRLKIDPTLLTSKKPSDVDKVFGERHYFSYLLSRTKIDRPPGYIAGVVKTIIDIGSKFQLELVPMGVDSAAREDILEAFLSKLHLETLDPLKVGDQLRLFLKGARIEKHGTYKHGLAVKLMFTEGFHIRFGKREDKFAEINAFVAPKSRPVETVPQAAPKTEPPAAIAPPGPNPVAGLSKNQRRKLKRPSAENEKEIVGETTVHREHLAPPVKQEPAKLYDREILKEAGLSAGKAPNQLPDKSSVNEDAPQSNTTPLLKLPEEYTEIGSVESKAKQVISLIGVVLEVDAATRSRGGTGDYLRSIRIADCTKPDSSSWTRGLKCNLFSRDEHLLPDPQLGDIIILKKVMSSDYRGTLMAVGQTNRHSWAIFSKDKREVYYGANLSPDSHRSAVSSPFYSPIPSDITYCEKLLDLCLDIDRKEQEEAERTRVVSAGYRTRRRCHRLVEELRPPGPELSDEYFNCTVEVLRGFSNENGVFTLWVTDYTKNPLAFPPQADWCPPQLVPYVFRIEMWDGAADEGLKMKEQTFYLLNNVRIRLNTAGYLEGKSVEPKQVLLEEATDDSVHFKSLLERRKAWQLETGYVPEKVEDKLLQNVSLDRPFHCTVEVLHTEHHEGKASMVYCTDYTSRDDFARIPSRAPWAKELETRIVKFILSEGQSLIAKFVKPGDFCRFNKMRLRLDRESGRVIGIVGGNQDSMEKLNPKNRENKILQDLFKRKEALFKPALPDSTFQEILDLKVFPEKYRVRGHVVSYEPRNLNEAIFLWCNTCKRQLRNVEKMCLECETDEALEPRSSLWLTVEDKDVNRVLVSVSEKDLDLPAYLDNPDVSGQLRQRLQPFLGALANKPLPAPVKGPPLTLEVVAWLDSAGDVAFTLVNASVA